MDVSTASSHERPHSLLLCNPKSFDLAPASAGDESDQVLLPQWRRTISSLPLTETGHLSLVVTSVDISTRSYMPSSHQLRPWRVSDLLLGKQYAAKPKAVQVGVPASSRSSPPAPPKRVSFATLFCVDGHGSSVALHVEFPVYMHLRVTPQVDDTTSIAALNKELESVFSSMVLAGAIHSFARQAKSGLMGFLPESLEKPTIRRSVGVWRVDFANVEECGDLVARMRRSITACPVILEIVDDMKTVTAEVMWYQQTRISAGVSLLVRGDSLVELDGPMMLTSAQVELSCTARVLTPLFKETVLIDHGAGGDTRDALGASPLLTTFHWHAEPSLDFGPPAVSLANGGPLVNVEARDDRGLPLLIRDNVPIAAIALTVESYAGPSVKQLVYVSAERDPVGGPGEVETALGRFSVNGYDLVRVSNEMECLEHWRNAMVVACPDVVHGPGSFSRQWRWVLARAAVACGKTCAFIQSKLMSKRGERLEESGAPVTGEIVRMCSESPVSSYRGPANGNWMHRFMCFGRVLARPVTLSARSQNIPGSAAETRIVVADIPGACDFDVCHYEHVTNKRLIQYDVDSLFRHHCPLAAGADLDLLSKAVEVVGASGVVDFVLASSCASLIAMDDVFKRGQQFAFTRSVCVYAFEQGLLVENQSKEFLPENGGPSSYTGAHVFESSQGIWTSPMLELDFCGFFTSIIRQFLLCFSTLVSPFTIDANGNIFRCDRWKYPHDFESSLERLYGAKQDTPATSALNLQRSSARTWRIVDGAHTFHFLDLGGDGEEGAYRSNKSLSCHMLDEFARRRGESKAAMSALKCDASLYNARTSTWTSSAAKRLYKRAKKLEKAFKLKGNATYGGFASRGRFRCSAVSAAATMYARLLLQRAARDVVVGWSSSLMSTGDASAASVRLRQALQSEVAQSLDTLATHEDAIVASNVQRFRAKSRDDCDGTNPFGVVLVQGDSDAFHVCITCINPRRGSPTLSPLQLSLAREVGLSIERWISEDVLVHRYRLPLISMQFKQIACPSIITSAKKRYAATVWTAAEKGGAQDDDGWISATILKSFDDKMDVPAVVQQSIRAVVECLLANLASHTSGVVRAIAVQPLREVVLSLKSALTTLDTIAIVSALVPFAKYQRFNRSSFTSGDASSGSGGASSPGRSAGMRLASDDPSYSFESGDRLGFVVTSINPSPQAFLSLRHVDLASRRQRLYVRKCPNGHSLCQMVVTQGGDGSDHRISPLPSTEYYLNMIATYTDSLIGLLPRSGSLTNGVSSLKENATALSVPSLYECLSMRCGGHGADTSSIRRTSGRSDGSVKPGAKKSASSAPAKRNTFFMFR